MSKQKLAFGAGAKSRRAWSQCISTVPVNRPVVWTGAAVVFSVVAVGFMAMASKGKATNPQTAAALPVTVFAQTFDEFDGSQTDSATLSVRPVSPMIFAKPADPAPQVSAYTTASVGGNAFAQASSSAQASAVAQAPTVAQASRERMAAKTETSEPWPRTTGPKTASNSAAPTDCLPDALRTVLKELEAKFGPVTIVNTTQLRTDNHSAGSERANLHTACKAVDIKTSHEPKEVTAFLHSRPEVGGVNSYRNRVVHFDLNAGYNSKTSKRTANQ